MAPKKALYRLLVRTGLICGALFVCSIGAWAAPSPQRASNTEIFTGEGQRVVVELEKMIWQEELSSRERRRLVELVAETIYRSEGRSPHTTSKRPSPR